MELLLTTRVTIPVCLRFVTPRFVVLDPIRVSVKIIRSPTLNDDAKSPLTGAVIVFPSKRLNPFAGTLDATLVHAFDKVVDELVISLQYSKILRLLWLTLSQCPKITRGVGSASKITYKSLVSLSAIWPKDITPLLEVIVY